MRSSRVESKSAFERAATDQFCLALARMHPKKGLYLPFFSFRLTGRDAYRLPALQERPQAKGAGISQNRRQSICHQWNRDSISATLNRSVEKSIAGARIRAFLGSRAIARKSRNWRPRSSLGPTNAATLCEGTHQDVRTGSSIVMKTSCSDSATSRRLYCDYAAELPLVDHHSHLSATEIAARCSET